MNFHKLQMNFQEKIDNIHLYIVLLFQFVNASGGDVINGETADCEFSQMDRYLKLPIVHSGSRRIGFDAYLEYLATYFKRAPISCLEEVYSMGDFAVYERFFDKIVMNFSMDGIFLTRKHFPMLYECKSTCRQIRILIFKRLYEQFTTGTELKENFQIVRLLIQVIKRYQIIVFSRFDNEYNKGLSDDIASWEFTMRKFGSNHPNGERKINLYEFFSIFHRIKKSEYDYNYYSLFAMYIQHLVKQRDIKFFKCLHPDLPLLVALILRYISDSGWPKFPFPGEIFEYYLDSAHFRDPVRIITTLETCLEAKKGIIELAKKKYSSKVYKSCTISALAKIWERSLILPIKDEEDQNIFWQLKGCALLENHLRTLSVARHTKTCR
jgi:hypothetical protein